MYLRVPPLGHWHSAGCAARLLLMLGFLLAPTAFAGIDAMQLRQLEAYQLGLRWDNIESKPYWVNGVHPDYSGQWQMHRVVLPAGQETSFYLPAYQSLRLHNPLQILRTEDINIFLSNGSGLAVQQALQKSQDGHSLLLSPQSATPLLVHVTPASASSVAFAAFVSRRVTLDDLAPYRELLFLPGIPVWLNQEPELQPEMYWPLVPAQPVTLHVEGPSRLQIKTRLLYESNAAELRQRYRLSYDLDQSQHQHWEFSTSVDARQITTANAAVVVCGREEQAYLEIPPGTHTLVLAADRALYLQALLQKSNDYLAPKLNQPRLPVAEVRRRTLLDTAALVRDEQQARRIASDNGRKDGGSSASALLRQAALARPDYPQGLSEAEGLQAGSTFYRDVLPAAKVSVATPVIAYFVPPQLKDVQQTRQDRIVAEQHEPAALRLLGQGYFTRLETAKKASLQRYLLPQRYAPSQLRLIVSAKDCRQRFFKLQYDRQPPTTLWLRCQSGVDTLDFVRSMPETALINLQQQSGGNWGDVTLNGLFAVNQQPAPLWPTASAEIPLPRVVRSVEVWSENGDEPPLMLALQYLDAKSLQLSEQSYLALLRELPRAGIAQRLRQALNSTQAESTEPEQAWLNQWQPLLRMLQTEYKVYREAAAQRPYPAGHGDAGLIQNWQAAATAAQQQGQWLEALEQWGKVVHHTEAEEQQQGLLAQADVLNALNEPYLAETLWRYLTLHAGPDMALRADARLRDYYTLQHDNDALQNLAAAMLVRSPSPEKIRRLIDILLVNGEYRFTLLLGLALADAPPLESMLRAAYQLDWWQTYESLLQKLPAPRQAFWQGLRAQKQGDFAAALDAWQGDDERGWQQHLMRGQQLHGRLNATRAGDLPALYQEWSRWQLRSPGAKTWRAAPWLIEDYSGSDVHYALERDLSRQAFRSTVERPALLSVPGPAVVVLHMRPLHDASQPPQALDGWIQINDNGTESVFPFSNNTPSQGLQLQGDGQYRLGRSVDLEYRVGAGIHKIRVFSKQAPLSLTLQEQSDEMPLAVLPPLQADTFLAAVQKTAAQTAATDPVQLIRQWQGRNRVIEILPPQQPSVEGETVAALPQLPVTVSESLAVPVADLTADAVLALPAADSRVKAQARMIQYLWLLEAQAAKPQLLLFAAEQLVNRFPQDRLLQGLWQRLSRFSEWRAVPSIVSSAGLRFVPVQGWQPENPVLRVRKALITPATDAEHVLFGDERLVLAMQNLSTITLHVDARLDDVAFLPEYPATLSWQLDDQMPQQLELQHRDERHRFAVQIPAGAHELRFYQAKNVSNQFIKIRFDDALSDLRVMQERAYFVSTRQAPLRFSLLGPAVVRIDTWEQGKLVSRFQNVAAGWQTVTVPPADGQQESLLNLYQRVPAAQAQEATNRIVQREPLPMPDPEVAVNDSKPAEIVRFDDALRLGAQEDGTWSVGVDLVRRNNNFQEGNSFGPEEQFGQYRLEHRYFDDISNTYWETKSFARGREYGGPTFGFNESALFMPRDWPVNFTFDAKAIMQVVHDQPEWLGELRYGMSQGFSLTPKTRLIPSWSVFVRHLSLRNELNNERIYKNDKKICKWNADQDVYLRKVDQDIYSCYKADHNYGQTAALLLQHRPWLDTLWMLGLGATSNEDMDLFDPDHLTLEAHWKQLLGEFMLDASYRSYFYQQDTDRLAAITRSRMGLEMSWQHWSILQNRLEVIADYTYDLQRSAHLGMLSLSLHFGEGRGYRDFKPISIDFSQIRQRQVPDARNNRVE